MPYVVGPRRPGDIATCFADASKAESELGWKATRTMEEMCVDGWRWQSTNPIGYRDNEDESQDTERKCKVFQLYSLE